MKSAIEIGVKEGAVLAAKEAIMVILELGRDREVTVKALDALVQCTSVDNTIITNCVFHGGEEEEE
jgi:hypothetical protein